MSFSKQLIIVTGMHRSGTSALARVVNLLGAKIPGTHMPATEDNPRGYWEATEVVRLNNKILKATGSHWSDDRFGPLSNDTIERFVPECTNIMRAFYTDASTLVLKDPRFCLLLPIWIKAAEVMKVGVKLIFIARHPEEVVASFKKRLDKPEYSPAAISSPKKALLLWMKYNLNIEYLSRSLPRFCLTYEQLIEKNESLLHRLSDFVNADGPAEVNISEALKFVDPELRRNLATRNCATEPLMPISEKIYAELTVLGSTDSGKPVAVALEHWRLRLNEVESRYERLRGTAALQPLEESIWLEKMTQVLAQHHERYFVRSTTKKVLFISGQPGSKGHLYRVEQSIEALALLKKRAEWAPASDVHLYTDEVLVDYELIFVFRAEWTPDLEQFYRVARQNSIPIVFDIDDLVFSPKFMDPLYFDYLRSLAKPDVEKWRKRCEELQKSLLASDFASVTTARLASEVESYNKRAVVIPNGFSERRLTTANQALQAAKPSKRDHIIRLGYASGTPTHQRDFEQICTALSRVLNEFANTRLTIVGKLDITEYQVLAPHVARIECRPLVPFETLPYELHRFDINLAPLEIGNPFCESKSELKYFEAALVNVPTIASRTSTMRAAIVDGYTGYCADSEEEWYANITKLINDPELRRTIAQRARYHAEAEYDVHCKKGCFAMVYELISQTL